MIGFSPHFVTIGNPERPIVHSRMTQLDYLPLSFGAEAQWGHNDTMGWNTSLIILLNDCSAASVDRKHSSENVTSHCLNLK